MEKRNRKKREKALVGCHLRQARPTLPDRNATRLPHSGPPAIAAGDRMRTNEQTH